MKKRTKKKVGKFAKNSFAWLGRLIFVYPAKGIAWAVKKTYHNTKKRHEEKVIEQKRPSVTAKYTSLDEIKVQTGSIKSFEKYLHTKPSSIGIILGARGSGKSALGMRLLENVHVKSKRKVYALGFKPETLPSWIKVVETLEQVHNDAAILIDEGGIMFSSRSSMSNPNKLLSELLLIARHKDLSVMFITQNSSNLEINAIRQADYLLLKPSSLLQKDFERKKIKDIYVEVHDDFKELKDTVGLTYVYSDSFKGFMANNLPSFWSEGASKGFK
jgi:hypothetical protein